MNPPAAAFERTRLARRRTALAAALGVVPFRLSTARGSVIKLVAACCVAVAGAAPLAPWRGQLPGRFEPWFSACSPPA